MEQKILVGNTVRLEANFKDFGGLPVNPQIVKIRIYNQKFEVINEVSVPFKQGSPTGSFTFDYIVPQNFLNQRVYYEWYGEISGSPSLNRGSFKVVFID